MGISVAALRRYPVKSMGGEALETAVLDARGLKGDRWFAVEDDDGHFASGKNTRRFRRRDQVFSYAATTAPSGEVVVAGPGGEWQVGDAGLDEELSTAMGVRVRIAPEGEVPHQDSGAVSLVGTATLAWCAERWGISVDPRRLRVNLLLDTDEPFVEEQWVGRDIALGDVLLRGVQRLPRCRMVDLDQDGARAEGRLLKPLTRERDMLLAVCADVVRTGVIRVGDAASTSP
ncbi:MOSC domain-containing protein [Nocardioides sp. JQ2195]|uniref:MOSC domain-containing protein n=1 Tax=Nocardioides sp. JQ2195 TaxID=2592334 RepID=UPI00143E1408|nr:MOSC N-terminal beta barrel domain-containing protein [Nocardioides sp. JQ2195]QIX28449.1 MOSC domain-containing protein [Nocardioides sp. JQ2195]